MARRRLSFGADAYLFYTASLVPIAVLVAAIGQHPGDFALALAIGVAAIASQAGLGSIGRRRNIASNVRWQIIRLLPPLFFVAAATRFIGGPSLPLISLYIPVVGAAAAAGRTQGLVAGAVAGFGLLAPELGNLGSPTGVALRTVTLTGVALVLGMGTRRIVRALEDALRASHAAVAAERRRARQIAALETVGASLAIGGPTEELIERVTDVIVNRFGYPHVSVYLGDRERVELVAHSGYRDTIEAFDSRTGVAGRVMRSGELAFVPNIATDPDYVPGKQAATSLICVPLMVDDRFLGLLNVESSGRRTLDATDRSLVVTIAGRIAAAIALGQDRQALAARIDLLRDIEAFGRDVSATLAIEPLADVVAGAAARIVGGDMIAVTILDRSDGRHLVRAVRGIPDRVIGREIRPGEGMAGSAIQSRRLVLEDGMNATRFPKAAQGLAVPDFVHGVGLPLVRDGVVVGAFTIGRTDPSAPPFSDLELEGLQLLAGSAALAVANAFLHADVGELAIRDPLTGLYNRRHFDEALDRMLAAHQRERLSGPRPLSAIVFDLDRFGLFNKQHGHQVGDEVLKSFANVLQGRFRAGDLVARLGGEEFIAVLDGSDRDQAMQIADEVRGLLGECRIVGEDGRRLSVTVSAGCTELDPADASRETLLRTADVALFMAKRAGRDRVVAA
ncbi:MAG: sensor domain-containing diguanylate cyclase [Candidatus Limnocylindria bacterium]